MMNYTGQDLQMMKHGQIHASTLGRIPVSVEVWSGRAWPVLGKRGWWVTLVPLHEGTGAWRLRMFVTSLEEISRLLGLTSSDAIWTLHMDEEKEKNVSDGTCAETYSVPFMMF
jgi:hypothetical protein